MHPPRVVVSIAGEPVPGDCTIDWAAASGKAFEASEPPGRDTTCIGRCVGKQLFISEVDEKKKKVEALIHVSAPVADDERLIGVFKSRSIKVISKPSKKRQSAKNLERKPAPLYESPLTVLWKFASTMARQYLYSIGYGHRLCQQNTCVFRAPVLPSRVPTVHRCLGLILIAALPLRLLRGLPAGVSVSN